MKKNNYFLLVLMFTLCTVAVAQTPLSREPSQRRIKALSDSTYLIQEFNTDSVMLFLGTYRAIDPDIRDGRFRFYDDKGRVKAVGYYYQDIPYGKWVYYNPDGIIDRVLDYKQVFDFLTKMNPDGRISRTDFINSREDNDRTLEGTFSASENLSTTSDVDQDPETDGKLFSISYGKFNGIGKCEELSVPNDLDENIVYPVYADGKRIAGKVVIRFTLNDQGRVDTAKILSGNSSDLIMEAMRVLLESDKWNAKYYQGKDRKEKVFTFQVKFVPGRWPLTK